MLILDKLRSRQMPGAPEFRNMKDTRRDAFERFNEQNLLYLDGTVTTPDARAERKHFVLIGDDCGTIDRG